MAEQHAKMRAALAGKLASDEEEARAKEEQVTLKEEHNSVVSTWKSRHKVRHLVTVGSMSSTLQSMGRGLGMRSLDLYRSR